MEIYLKSQRKRETYTIYLRSNIGDPVVYISHNFSFVSARFADRIFVGETYKLDPLAARVLCRTSVCNIDQNLRWGFGCRHDSMMRRRQRRRRMKILLRYYRNETAFAACYEMHKQNSVHDLFHKRARALLASIKNKKLTKNRNV